MTEHAAVRIAVRELDDGRVAVTATGHLDVFTAPELESVVLRVLAAGKDVLVELELVSMIDSSGLWALFATARAARDAGRRLSLTRGSEAVRSAVTGGALDRVLPWEHARDDAGTR